MQMQGFLMTKIRTFQPFCNRINRNSTLLVPNCFTLITGKKGWGYVRVCRSQHIPHEAAVS